MNEVSHKPENYNYDDGHYNVNIELNYKKINMFIM